MKIYLPQMVKQQEFSLKSFGWIGYWLLAIDMEIIDDLFN